MGKYYFIGLFLAAGFILIFGLLGIAETTAILALVGVNFAFLFSIARDLQYLKGKRK